MGNIIFFKSRNIVEICGIMRHKFKKNDLVGHLEPLREPATFRAAQTKISEETSDISGR